MPLSYTDLRVRHTLSLVATTVRTDDVRGSGSRQAPARDSTVSRRSSCPDRAGPRHRAPQCTTSCTNLQRDGETP